MGFFPISRRVKVRWGLLAGGIAAFALAFAAGGLRIAGQSSPTPAKPRIVVDFARDIAPIFQKSCLPCHSGEKPQAGLRLETEAQVLKGGQSGKAIIPGDSAKSPLVKRLIGEGEEARMPMGANPLPAAQIKLIRTWIDQNNFGAIEVAVPAQTTPVASHIESGSSDLFATRIRPILAARCYACHGPELHQNGLRLDSLAAMLKGSDNGRVVVPGASGKSPIVRRLLALDRPQMPYGAPPLNAEEVELIRKWIDQGAPGPDSSAPVIAASTQRHWAYMKPVRPDVPPVKNPGWCRNPVDTFVLARLEKEGLSPSPEAAKETLIRRVTLDLIGLPPTLQEVDAFLADTSPNAYEKVVDRLLASPRYGERWAAPWLDLARYADTHGYEADHIRSMWQYRDWVIDALNNDMSFREFTIEQIAGDMLPHPSASQLIASGFNRNTMTNMEGGVDPEEYYWYSQVDRVNTTATVWLGSTLGCAECHNHKFDPFTQKDYYRFLAFFADEDYHVADDGSGDQYVREAVLELPTSEQAAKSKEFREEVSRLQAVLNTPTAELAAAQEKWEDDIKAAEPHWTVLHPSDYVSKGGAKLTLLPDGSLLAGGKNPDADAYDVTARTDLTGISGLRLEVMNDPSLPATGPGRAPDGNFFLTGFEAEAAAADKPADAQKIRFKQAAADDSQRDSGDEDAAGYSFKNLVNDKPQPKGWSIQPTTDKSLVVRRGVLVPEKPFGFAAGTVLTFHLKHNMPHSQIAIGRFRISVTTMADPLRVTTVPAWLHAVLDLPPAQRTEVQQSDLAAAYRAIAPSLEPTRNKIAEIKKEDEKLGIVTTLVMREKPSFDRPCTFMHVRGAFTSPADKVCAGVPSTLNPMADDQMPNRLGLAEWLVSEDNPLTARVAVNRLWEQLFGRGIVETSEDFGTQGTPPTHPELLDWLATEFPRQSWSVKKMLRLMVTSATYRQSSDVAPLLQERDPYNKLLARGPRFRVPAETIRDSALAASGLLSSKIGGPSVFPYQPDGIWDRPYNDEKWVESRGEDRYRRSLYAFIRRTSPYPSWSTFDAPTREFCTVRRVRTNTPLQALTTLNDPVFFEASQALAGRMTRDAGTDPASRATYGFRLCLTRRPAAPELERILGYYRLELKHFQADPKAAGKVAGAKVGPNPNIPDLAAWTMVSNVLLNLDETITKE